MNRKKSTSVVLAVYNGEKYLKEQLESLLKQSLKPDELIIIDDASTDNSLEIINGYKDQFKNVILKSHLINLGITKSFEDGIKLATGDYIFLSDQDDYWLKDKIADYLIEFEKNEKALLIFSDATITDEKLIPTGETLFGFLDIHDLNEVKFNLLHKGNIVQGATIAFKSILKESILPLPSNWVHDHWIATIASLKGSLIKLNKEYMLYRQHDNNAIGLTKHRSKKQNIKRSSKSLKATYLEILPKRKEKYIIFDQLNDRIHSKAITNDERLLKKNHNVLRITSSLDDFRKIKLLFYLMYFFMIKRPSIYVPLTKKDYIRDILYVISR